MTYNVFGVTLNLALSICLSVTCTVIQNAVQILYAFGASVINSALNSCNVRIVQSKILKF